MIFNRDKNITDEKFLEKEPYWSAISKSTAIIEFSPEGEIISANKNFLNATGYSLKDIVGQHHKIFCSEKDVRTNEYASFWKNLARGNFFSGTFKRYDKNGNPIWLEASYNPVIKDDKVIKIIKIAADVTAKIEASNQSRFLVDSINKSTAIIEFDTTGKILSANENFSKVMGYSLQEIVGRHHSIFCERGLSESLEYANFWKDLSRGVFKAGQFPRITKFNKKVWLEATYNTVLDADGNVARVIKVARDVTAAVDNRKNDESIAEKIHETSQAVTEDALNNRNILNNATKKNQEVKDLMKAAEDKVNELAKKIANINELLDKVKEIAHQTHLLSLNASVEAASAGANGKGFAVVAAEVKRLAGFSSQASDHISKVIEDIKKDSVETAKQIKMCTDQTVSANEATISAQKSLEKIVFEIDKLGSQVKEFSTIKK